MAQAGLISTLCPVAPLALEAARTAHRIIGATVEDWGELTDRMDALSDASSYLRAASEGGAYFQLLQAIGELDPEMNWVCDDAVSRRVARRQRRLVASAAALIRPQVPSSVRDALESYYGAPRRFLA